MSSNEFQKSKKRFLRRHKPLFLWLQILIDLLAVVSLLFILAWIVDGELKSQYRMLSLLCVLLMLGVYNYTGYYNRMRSTVDSLWALFESWNIVLLLLLISIFVTKSAESYSRSVMILWAITGFFVQLSLSVLSNFVQSKLQIEKINTIFIGAQPLTKYLVQKISQNKWIPDHVVGVIEDDSDLINQWDTQLNPILGSISDLPDVIDQFEVRRIYICIPVEQSSKIKSIISLVDEKSTDIIWAPDIFDFNLLNPHIKEIAGIPIISLSETPLIGSSRLFKEIFDRTLAFFLILALSPLFLITSALIKLTSKGPVFFFQKRHGLDGKVFNLIKFRSMKVDDTDSDKKVVQATRNDSRITWIGKFIRRTSIDELPQLINVISGTMSLVGPRPHAVEHNDYYSNRIRAYMTRHRIKPGLTGLAQVNGFRGETDTDDKMKSRVEYDLIYINNWSIWLDLEIMVRTLFVLIGKNAY